MQKRGRTDHARVSLSRVSLLNDSAHLPFLPAAGDGGNGPHVAECPSLLTGKKPYRLQQYPVSLGAPI